MLHVVQVRPVRRPGLGFRSRLGARKSSAVRPVCCSRLLLVVASGAGRGRPVVLYGASRGAEGSCCSPPTCRTWPTASWPAHPARSSTLRSAWSRAASTFGGHWHRDDHPGHPHPGPSADGRRRLGLRVSSQHHHEQATRLPDHAPATNLYYPGIWHCHFGARTSRSSSIPRWQDWAAACKPTPRPPSSSGPA
jgi:hypothetical protein